MHFLLAMMVSLLATVTHASESISYSGRLVNSNGSPVGGNVNLTFDLAYSGQLGVNVCSQNLDGIGLVNGVFHVALDFPNCNLTNVLATIPSGQSLSIRVTDRTKDPNRVYSFQAIHSVPFSLMSEISKQLSQMSAAEGQVLTWDDTNKLWVPRTPAAPSGGTVASVSGDQGLISSTSSGNVTIGILDEGVTSAKIKDATIVDADISATAEIEQTKIKNLTTALASKEAALSSSTTTNYLDGTKSWVNFDSSVRNALLLGYTTGAALPLASTDNVMEGLAKLEGQIIANDTAFESAGQWSEDGSLIYYNTGNVGIGTNAPSEKLEVVGNIGVSGKVKLKDSGSNYVDLRAPVTIGSNIILTLPGSTGTSGQVLVTDGTGVLSWSTSTTSSSDIVDGSIVDADVSGTANIAQSKIAGLTTDLGSKEPTLAAGTSAQYYRGDKTWQTLNTDAVPEGTKLYFTEPKVLGTDLLGFSSGAGAITAADTVLSSIGKLDGNIAAVSSLQANYVLKSGDTMSGALAMGSNKITGLSDPTVSTDAATKNYVDTQVSSVTVTPGGVDEDIQFNNAGSLGGVPKFKYSSANNSVFLGDKPSGSSNNYLYMNAGTNDRSGIQMFTNTSGTAPADGFDIAAVFGYAEINLKEAGYLMLKTFDLERMRITATGNIGINTETPAEKLDVTGNIALSGKLRLKSDTVNYIELKAPLSLATTRAFTLPNAYGTSGNALITDGAGNLSWGAVATTASSVGGDLSGTIGSAEIVSGAVGSAEIADLSIVNGDIANSTITYGKMNLIDGDIPLLKVNGLQTALDGKEPSVVISDSTTYWRGDKSWQTLNTSVVPEGSRLYFLDSRVRSALLTGYSLVSTSAIPLADTDDLLTALKKLELQNTATSTTLNSNGQWSKNGTSVYYTAGGVGINTSAPVNKFNVSADGTTKAIFDANELFQFHGGNSNYGTISGDNITLGMGVHDFSGDSIFTSTNEGAWVGSLTNAPFVLRTNNLERVRISETGAVGVGTISPEYKLHIAGNNINNLLLLENQSSTVTTFPSLGIDNYQGATSGHPALGLKNAGGTKTAPTAIAGGNNLGTFLAYGHNGTSFVQGARIDISADANFTATSAPTSMRFHTTNANSLTYEERMRITPSGSVGIGTQAPASKLDVKGSISAHGQSFPWRWKANSTGVNFGTTTWVDLTIINVNLPANADVEVRFDGSVYASETGVHCSFRFLIDGVALSDNATYGDHIVMGHTTDWWHAVGRTRWIDNMAAGNHVIKVQGSAQPAASTVNGCRVDGTDYSRIRTTVMAYPVQ